jgi:hypothetical protein
MGLRQVLQETWWAAGNVLNTKTWKTEKGWFSLYEVSNEAKTLYRKKQQWFLMVAICEHVIDVDGNVCTIASCTNSYEYCLKVL